MNEVYRVIGAASRRLLVIDWLRALAWTLTVAISGMVIARVVQQVFGLGSFPWYAPYGGIFAGGGAAAVVAAIVWTAISRRRTGAVARELDDRAGLRESLSTALYAEKQSNDPWCDAVIETARARAANVNVRQAIPLEAPRLWPVPVGCAALLAVLWFTLQPLDVLGTLKREQKRQAQQAQVEAVKHDLDAKDKKLEELLAKAKLDINKDEAAKLEPQKHDEPLKPEDLQRAAVKKLTEASEKLAQMRNGEKETQADAMKEAMSKLKQPGDGPLNELARAMARGNFEKAEEALKDLNQKLSDGQLTDQQKADLKAQLQNMSEQLKQIAQDKKEMEKKLEAAGMDAKTAKELMKKAAENPEELKKALENMKNLSEEQKKQLMDQAMGACKAGDQCDKMGESMSKMSQGMGKEGMDQEAMEGMGQLAAQMSQASLSEQEMKDLDAAMAECREQLQALGECMGGEGEGDKPGLGQWRQGEDKGHGMGSGGPGQGNYGGNRADNPADYNTKKEKAKGKNGGGPIIGSKLVYGEQVKGESVAEFSQAVEAGEKAAADAIESYQVPIPLQPAVKAYFGRLNEAGKPAADKVKPPASDAKDAKK